MSLRQSLINVANKIEDMFDTIWRTFRGLFHRGTQVTIIPFVGYGNVYHVRLRGRVLENHTVRKPRDTDNAFHNLWNIIRRFNSHEMRHVKLTITFNAQQQTVTTDDEGFFYLEFEFEEALAETHYTARYHYVDGQRESTTTGDIIIAPTDAQFAVVSDMDDTVLHSNVPNRIKLVATTLFNNARTRLPFAGVAQFYRSLQHGTNNSFNPIYYVSNSPYNLYDLLQDFFAIREIPTGPIFLRDFGLTSRYVGASEGHKAVQITRLLELHPTLRFILIGDSGEHDPDIYAEIVKQYPNRIAAIYIRDVRPGKKWKMNDHTQQVAAEIRELGVDMLLIKDTLAAAKHALEKGFVEESCIEAVEAAVNADLPSNPLEAFIDEATS